MFLSVRTNLFMHNYFCFLEIWYVKLITFGHEPWRDVNSLLCSSSPCIHSWSETKARSCPQAIEKSKEELPIKQEKTLLWSNIFKVKWCDQPFKLIKVAISWHFQCHFIKIFAWWQSFFPSIKLLNESYLYTSFYSLWWSFW